MSRVLLFNPPHPEAKGFTREGRCTQEAGIWGTQWPPLSLATAASMLRSTGHEVRVVDCPAVRMPPKGLLDLVRRFRPHAALWHTATPTLDYDLGLGAQIKQAHPGTLTGVMGTHVTALPETALKQPGVDVVIRGEPEYTMRDLVDHLEDDWTALPGISRREANGPEIRHAPDRPFMPSDMIPLPAWEGLDLSPYRLPLKGRRFLMVAPSRGCPYPCSFCTAALYYGRKLRKRPVNHVLAEIERNVTRFAVRDVFFWADTFTADKAYVAALCRGIIDRGLSIAWACNSRVDTVDAALLRTMRRAGLWMISFGIESGSDTVLARTGKGITVAQSKRAVRAAHGCGIRTSGHFIVGLPGETVEGMQQTLDLALNLPLDIAQFYAAAPFPGTRLYAEAVEKGWLAVDNRFSQSRAVMNLPGLPADQVDAFIRHAYRRFYTTPRTLARLTAMTAPGALRHIAGNVRRIGGLRIRR